VVSRLACECNGHGRYGAGRHGARGHGPGGLRRGPGEVDGAGGVEPRAPELGVARRPEAALETVLRHAEVAHANVTYH